MTESEKRSCAPLVAIMGSISKKKKRYYMASNCLTLSHIHLSNYIWAIGNVPLVSVSSAFELQCKNIWYSEKKHSYRKNFSFGRITFVPALAIAEVVSWTEAEVRGVPGLINADLLSRQWRKLQFIYSFWHACFINYSCSLWQCRQVLLWWESDPAVTCNEDIHLVRWIPSSSLLL